MAINFSANFISDQITSLTGGHFSGIQLELISALTLIVAFIILAKVTDIIFERIFLRIAKKTKTELDDKILAVLKLPIFITVALLGLILSLGMITLLEGAMTVLADIAKTLVTIVWTIATAKIALILINDVVGKVASKTKSTLDDEMLPLMRNIANLIIYFLGLITILSIWEINVTPFLATAGVAGIAIAFAAQNTIAHIFGGISVYFDKPFKVGDRIQLDSGEYGDVTEIGIRSTKILTLDETLIVIPNDTIANSKIINYHAPHSRMKVKLRIGVSYGSDVARVKKTLIKIAKSVPEVLEDPEPVVLFVEHGNFSLNFLLITWVNSPELKGTVTDKLNEGIDREFRKEKISIPFPTQTIYAIKQK